MLGKMIQLSISAILLFLLNLDSIQMLKRGIPVSDRCASSPHTCRMALLVNSQYFLKGLPRFAGKVKLLHKELI